MFIVMTSNFTVFDDGDKLNRNKLAAAISGVLAKTLSAKPVRVTSLHTERRSPLKGNI
jgi:hypothetical protein